LATHTPLTLCDEGRAQAAQWGDAVAAAHTRVVYGSDEQTSLETAEIIAARSGARRKTVSALAEVDAGLWDGLTAEELFKRYPKTFKRWRAEPSSVRPPKGEAVEPAFERLVAALSQTLKKRNGHPPAIVVGPMAGAIIRCLIEDGNHELLRHFALERPLCYNAASNGEGFVGPVPLVEPATVEKR